MKINHIVKYLVFISFIGIATHKVITQNVCCIFEQWFDVKGREGRYEFLGGRLKSLFD
jgi:hypothetical protein